MISKRAQIGSTLTWIVAFIVIFIVMLLFVTITMGLAKVKGFTGTDKAQYTFSYYSGPVVYNNFMIFLNTPLENNLTIEKILTQVRAGETNKPLEDIFKRECQKYLDANFPSYTYGDSFIALYSYDEKGFNYLSGYSCDNFVNIISEYPVLSTLVNKVEVPIFPNKKIMLSVSKS